MILDTSTFSTMVLSPVSTTQDGTEYDGSQYSSIQYDGTQSQLMLSYMEGVVRQGQQSSDDNMGVS